MTPETYTRLLKDLQKLQKALVDEYVAAVRASDALTARMRRRHAAAEVGGRLDDFVVLAARRSAVQLLLRTVYVRVLEDLDALEPVRIRGDWGLAAFREVAPALRVRSYLRWVFRDLAADFPALFVPGPDELPLPSEDLCQRIWELWHRDDGQGQLVYDWRGDGFDSRFLGDLYQDLDAEVRKRYALLQTPEFVEQYILDHTLTPALDEFDPAALRDRGETFRLLDPTCGSGHFLIGGFHRLADYWEAQGLDAWDAAERALESIWGCDINAHATDIARFRLLLEVRTRTGVTDLERLAGLEVNLRAMDSLVPWERLNEGQQEMFPGRDRLNEYGTLSEREENASFLGGDFRVVVGNPPYIRPKDSQKLQDYREFWPVSAAGRYAMSAPFAERLLSIGAHDSFVGQITSNSFAKRSFGRSLVENVFIKFDLTHIVDTSGAYIPGHGTPTVILFSRTRSPEAALIIAVLGKRGEPGRPDNPARGFVWTDISRAAQEPDESSPYVSVKLTERAVFGTHPWVLSGGASPEILATIEGSSTRTVADACRNIGNTTQLKADEIYFDYPPAVARDAACATIELLEGEYLRDWVIHPARLVPYPYSYGTKRPIDLSPASSTYRHFWRYRPHLLRRPAVGFRTIASRGQKFFEYPFQAPGTVHRTAITFAFVGTHNHFALSRGGRLLKQSVYGIFLSDEATEDDHLDLLGLLNSSALGFWMRQVFHDKGGGGIGGGLATEEWEHFYEYDSTKLKKAPTTSADREPRIALASALDELATARARLLPTQIFAGDDWTAVDLDTCLDDARIEYAALTRVLVALQEELDWLTYHSHSLLDEDLSVGPDEIEPLTPGHRPFEILFARRDEQAAPDERSVWWERHGHDKVTEVPDHYSAAHRSRIQRRTEIIESDPRINLLEQPAYKRRWLTPDLNKEAVKAAEAWLLDRLEDLFAPAADDAPAGPLARPEPHRLEEIVSSWQRDSRVAAVAKVWTGQGDVDLTLVAEQLLQANALPDNPYRLYTAEGLRKLDAWKATWHLQDLEDQGQPLIDPETGEPLDEIPLPPKFIKKDFQTARAFQIRGKLNVPRERFILFADLTPPRYGWNGWRDRDRALAQVDAYTLAEADPHAPLPAPTAADPRRCGPTLGLWESLPDVRRWGDPAEHAELQALAHEVCQQTHCPCAIVDSWQAWQRGDLTLTAPDAPAPDAEVTVDERATVTRALVLFGDRGATLTELLQRWPTSPARLQQVLDDLLASGDLQTRGRARRKRYSTARRYSR